MPKQTDQLELLFCWGSWQWKIRETFDKARPIRNRLPREIDPGYILFLLREQTYIAMKWRDPVQRELERHWRELCRAMDTFVSVVDKSASKELAEDLQNKRASAEAAGTNVTYWPKVEKLKPTATMDDALKSYSEKYHLPSYEEALEKKDGEKSDAFWSDAVALALANYFDEKTGTPKWPTVAQLMSCAPPMKYKQKKGPGETTVSMEREDIRRRIVRRQREKKLPERYKPTIGEIAYELKRFYAEWVKAGAKDACPSFIHATDWPPRPSTTSLSDKRFTELMTDLHKKYRTEEELIKPSR